MPTILYVCTANICRSAMCQFITENLLAGSSVAGKITVKSAGTEALAGFGPQKFTVQVCQEHEIDITPHIAQQLTDALLAEADLVLCLAERHKKMILDVHPELVTKVFLLKEFDQPELPPSLSVDDPTGEPKKNYDVCFEELTSEIIRILPSLAALAFSPEM